MAIPPEQKQSLEFSKLIAMYAGIQSKVQIQIQSLAAHASQTSPGQFLLVQFAMSQVTQIGESISNLIAQVNTVISGTIRNQKTQ